VAFCGHSKNNFGGEYGALEKELFSTINSYYLQTSAPLGANDLKDKVELLLIGGLRLSTVRKIC